MRLRSINRIWQKHRHMKSSTSAFLSAHAATMEVLGVAGKVKYHHRFRRKVQQMSDVCSAVWGLKIWNCGRSIT